MSSKGECVCQSTMEIRRKHCFPRNTCKGQLCWMLGGEGAIRGSFDLRRDRKSSQEKPQDRSLLFQTQAQQLNSGLEFLSLALTTYISDI